jgi:hypothetical protein
VGLSPQRDAQRQELVKLGSRDMARMERPSRESILRGKHIRYSTIGTIRSAIISVRILLKPHSENSETIPSVYDMACHLHPVVLSQCLYFTSVLPEGRMESSQERVRDTLWSSWSTVAVSIV